MMRKIASIILVAFITFSAYASGKKENPELAVSDSTSVVSGPDEYSPDTDTLAQSPQPEKSFTPASAPSSPAYASPPLNGIYVGILEFGSTAKEITPEFVLLDPFGKQQLLNYIDNYRPLAEPGSAYYYAVHKALTNVEQYKEKSQLPQDAKTAMIAITDGLDTASTNQDLHTPPLLQSPALGNYNIRSLAQYHLYVEQLLDEKQVNLTTLEVFGADTQTPAPQNAFFANKSLNENITDIVNYSMGSLIATPATTVVAVPAATGGLPRTTLMLPSAVYPVDTQLRIVFDGQPAANSTKYIEGRVSVSGNGDYALTNITASGIRLLTSGGIPGTKSQTGITYKITVNDTINPSQVKQYYKQPPILGRISTDWILNSEFGSITIAEEEFVEEEYAEEDYADGVGADNGLQDDAYRKNSVIVYLLLDGRSSLSDGQTVEQIRRKAKDVINRLYNAVSNPTQRVSIQTIPASEEPQTTTQAINLLMPAPQPQQPPQPPQPQKKSAPKNTQFVDVLITGPYNGGYWVQVSAFQNSENMRWLTNVLQSRNYRMDTGLTTVQDGTLLRRVLVGGPYSRAGAENELLLIKELVLQ